MEGEVPEVKCVHHWDVYIDEEAKEEYGICRKCGERKVFRVLSQFKPPRRILGKGGSCGRSSYHYPIDETESSWSNGIKVLEEG